MTINDLVESLIIEVPECPLPTIRDMIRWAQRELCSEGNVWVVSDGPVVVGANTPFAEVEAPLGAEILRIISLADGDRALVPGANFKQLGGGGVLFVRSPPEGAMLTGSVSCMPAYGKDLPASIMSRWSEAIMDGARSRLLILPQPWQNPVLSEHYRRKFLDALAYAGDLASTGHQYGSIRMKVRGSI